MTEAITLDDILTASELADYLGVSTRALNNWRGLPRIQIGQHRYYVRQNVTSWLLARQTGQPTANNVGSAL